MAALSNLLYLHTTTAYTKSYHLTACHHRYSTSSTTVPGTTTMTANVDMNYSSDIEAAHPHSQRPLQAVPNNTGKEKLTTVFSTVAGES